jgi:DNA helicase-2/ATP-dependent DNA helicase PcrA
MDPFEIRAQSSTSVLAHDYSQGPLLLLAGPGTGKTYSLLETIRTKVEDGASVDDFFEATLTNAAADDFITTAHQRVSEDFSASSTLHFRAKGLLHKHAEAAHLYAGFTVIDQLCEDVILGDLTARLAIPGDALGPQLFSYRREVATAQEVDSPFSGVYRQIQDFYSALDWFDVIRLACDLLETNKEIRDKEGDEFQYLLIDEYQDLNASDQRFIELLLNGGRTLLAVGDDDQSIYSGRFADATGITNFQSRYPDAEIIQLPVTSRIPSAIIEASYHLISRNTVRAPKDQLIPLPDTDGRAGGGFVISVNTRSAKAEAQFIHDAIAGLLDQNVAPSEILVLCACRALGLELLERVSEMDSDGRIPLRNDLEARDSLSPDSYAFQKLVGLIANHDDNLAVRIVLDTFLDKDATEIRSLVFHAMDRGISMWEAMGDTDLLDTLSTMQSAIVEFMRQVEALEAGLLPYDAAGRLVQEFPPLQNLAPQLEIGPAPQDEEPQDLEPDTHQTDAVRFITFHSSKGLEADFVFMPFMEDDLGLPADSEEERRRLLYVALTRAKIGVTMSWAWSRRSDKRFKCSGKGGDVTHRQPSHHIAECGIDPSLAKPWQGESPTEIALEILTNHAGAHGP